MSMARDPEVERFFYRSSTPSRGHRNRVSAYFVQRVRGAKVVARIEPRGLVPASIGDEQLAIQRLKRNLVAAGTWKETPSGRHLRQRVVVDQVVTAQEVAPQSSRRVRGATVLVVETGVDPVTSRFSGARSTD